MTNLLFLGGMFGTFGPPRVDMKVQNAVRDFVKSDSLSMAADAAPECFAEVNSRWDAVLAGARGRVFESHRPDQ